MPGTYIAGEPLVTIAAFAPQLHVITSKQRPRKLTIHGSDGAEYMFLLKGHEDLRQDERVMQLFGLVNNMLATDRVTAERDLSIARYAVIPLSPNSGLIGWVPNTDTLHALIREYRDARKIPLNVEHRLMLGMAPDYDHLTVIQKVEVFEHALDSTSGAPPRRRQLRRRRQAVGPSARPLRAPTRPPARRGGPAQGAVAQEPQQRGLAGAPHKLHQEHRGDEHGGLHLGAGGPPPLQPHAGPLLRWARGGGAGAHGSSPVAAVGCAGPPEPACAPSPSVARATTPARAQANCCTSTLATASRRACTARSSRRRSPSASRA